MNYQLVRAGFWPVNIRCSEDRLKYDEALEAWDVSRDVNPMIAMIAGNEAEQLKICIEIAQEQERALHKSK